MKKILSLCVFCASLAMVSATTLEVRSYQFNSQPTARRKITLTLTTAGPVVQSPWLIAGDSVAAFTDTNGVAWFSNVLAGAYRLDIAGSPSRSFPLTVADTNTVVNAATLINSTNSNTSFYTATQVDALIANVVGGSATNVNLAAAGLATVTTNSASYWTVTVPAATVGAVTATNALAATTATNAPDGYYVASTNQLNTASNALYTFASTNAGSVAGITNNQQLPGDITITNTGNAASLTIAANSGLGGTSASIVAQPYGIVITNDIFAGNITAGVIQADGIAGILTNPVTGPINSSTGYFAALSTPSLTLDNLIVATNYTGVTNSEWLATDSAGKLIAGSGNAATATAATSYPFKSVVAIGDSLTWSVGRYSYVYGLVTNHGFVCLTNSGTSGNTVGAIVTNQLDLAKTFLGKQRASVLLWAGKNDQQYDNQFDPLPCVNTITNGLAAGIQRIWAMGADPVVMTLPHTYSDATYWPTFTNSESKTALVNQWLTNLPSNTNFLLGRTLTVVDVASAYPLSSYTNPPTGGGVLNSNVTYDGLHFSDAAKTNIASMVAAAISNSVAWQRPQTFGGVNLDVDSMSSNFVWMATNATATSATDTNAADWDAMSFIIAAQLTSPLEISAVHALVKRLKSDGNWNGLKVLYPFVGASSNSMSLNLRDITTYRLAFTGSGLTYTASGISADGTSYGNTQFNPITAGLNTTNAHAFLWLKTQSSTNNTYYFGANGASSSNYRWFIRRDNSGTNTYGAGIGDATATTGSVTTNGAYMLQRVESANAQFWARYTKSEWASTATQLPDRELGLFGYNTGSVGFLAGGTISGLAFGQAMSDTAASNYVNSWVVFQTTLGRQ